MKGFIVTIILFAILILVIVTNGIFVNNVHKEMYALTESLSPSPSLENEKLIFEIETLWKSKKRLLSISVSFSQIDEVTKRIDALLASNHLNDASQTAINIKLLQNSIDAIKRLEMLSIENIL
jgi:hypothetical protein